MSETFDTTVAAFARVRDGKFHRHMDGAPEGGLPSLYLSADSGRRGAFHCDGDEYVPVSVRVIVTPAGQPIADLVPRAELEATKQQLAQAQATAAACVRELRYLAIHGNADNVGCALCGAESSRGQQLHHKPTCILSRPNPGQSLLDLARETGAQWDADRNDWFMPYYAADGSHEMLPTVEWIARRKEAAREMAKLRDTSEAYQRSGLDISPCMKCGKAVVCLPDGMPMCQACGEAIEAEYDKVKGTV
jgi:hypothetical protein